MVCHYCTIMLLLLTPCSYLVHFILGRVEKNNSGSFENKDGKWPSFTYTYKFSFLQAASANKTLFCIFFSVSSEILWLQIFLNYRNTVIRLFGPSADFDNDLLKSVRDFASCCEGLVLNHGNPTTFLIWPFVMCLPHSSPIGSFGFFSLMTASLTYINKSLDLML